MTKEEKLQAALDILGQSHILHKANSVKRKPRPCDRAAVDVSKTFDRIRRERRKAQAEVAPVVTQIRGAK